MTDAEHAEHKRVVELRETRAEAGLTACVLAALIASVPYRGSSNSRLMEAVDNELEKLLNLREKQAEIEILAVQMALK